jgi:uncharacterized protein (DUF433 family)
MATALSPHIEIGPDGVPIIAGTNTKVVEIILPHLAWGWQGDQLHENYPHLSLGQIYSALSYYYDHQQEVDDDLRRREEMVDEIQARWGELPLRLRLKLSGRRA